MSGSTTFATGSSKGESNIDSESADYLRSLALQFTEETGDLRRGVVSELESALSGDLSSSQQNLIAQSIENSLQSGSRSLEQVSDELARTGLSDTPFGISQLASTIQSGNQATSQVGTNLKNQIYNNALQMSSNYVLGQTQTAASGLSGAIEGDQTTNTKGDSIGHSTTGTYSMGSK